DGDLARPVTVAALETLGRPQVQVHPFADGDPSIEHLLVQGMNERIPPGHRPVGPLRDADPPKELTTSRQRLAPYIALRGLNPRRHPARRGNLNPCDPGGHQ